MHVKLRRIEERNGGCLALFDQGGIIVLVRASRSGKSTESSVFCMQGPAKKYWTVYPLVLLKRVLVYTCLSY